VLFEASRPILLNGIEDGISRPDLGDRAIFLTLAPIAEMERRPEADLAPIAAKKFHNHPGSRDSRGWIPLDFLVGPAGDDPSPRHPCNA
jgi:hypothetical protein